MAECTYVTEGRYQTDQRCEQSWVLHEAVARAEGPIELVGTFDEGPYHLPPWHGSYSGYDPYTPYSPIELHGGRFEDGYGDRCVYVSEGPEYVKFVGSTFDCTVKSEWARLALVDVVLEDQGRVTSLGGRLDLLGVVMDHTPSAAIHTWAGAEVTIEGGSWNAGATPLLWSQGGRVTATGLVVADARSVGRDASWAALLFQGAEVTLDQLWMCGQHTRSIAASCEAGAECSISRSLFRDADTDGAMVALDGGRWVLDGVTFHADRPVDRRGAWGLRVASRARVDVWNALVSPAQLWASSSGTLTEHAVSHVEVGATRGWSEPEWTECRPSIPDPEALGWEVGAIPGAFSGIDEGAPFQHAWNGDADEDGWPAMWDCAPEDPDRGGPEVGGNDVDEDCDGRRLCAADDDRDGWWSTVEVGSDPGLACEAAEGEPDDPDDADPCIPDPGAAACDRAPDPDPATPAVAGFVGSGCTTGPGGPGGAAWLAGVALARRRVRHARGAAR